MTYSELQDELDRTDMIAKSRRERAARLAEQMPSTAALVQTQAIFAATFNGPRPVYQ